MAHVWRCPAFDSERHALRQALEEKIMKWNLPYASKRLVSKEDKNCERLICKANSALRRASCDMIAIPSQHCLHTLAHNFWRANKHKPVIPIRSFVTHVITMFKLCTCPHNGHTCGARTPLSIPAELAHIVIR